MSAGQSLGLSRFVTLPRRTTADTEGITVTYPGYLTASAYAPKGSANRYFSCLATVRDGTLSLGSTRLAVPRPRDVLTRFHQSRSPFRQ